MAFDHGACRRAHVERESVGGSGRGGSKPRSDVEFVGAPVRREAGRFAGTAGVRGTFGSSKAGRGTSLRGRKKNRRGFGEVPLKD